MAPVTLEGHTLGHKHRNYNKIFKESVTNQTKDVLKDIDLNEDDVNNSIKVDMASAVRNVDYILGILKGNDMLYISRAITRCPWLINDSSYAYLIEPEYLYSHLIPLMMAKAANKLMLHIRLNLRDETRVQNFFSYYENFDLKTALKWLPHCSVPFIETKVEKYSSNINPHLLKRLCEKSHHVLKVYVMSTKDRGYIKKELQETLFLLNTHIDFYLDLVETRREREFPKFNSKCTKTLMKARPGRVNQNFSKYANNIHLPTFVKFLNENKVREFLLTQANIEKERYSNWINYENLQHFIKIMPQEERLRFIKDIFINKSFKKNEDSSSDREDEEEEDTTDDERSGMMRLYKFITAYGDEHTELLQWYNFIPFDLALTEVKEKLKSTEDEDDRYGRLECLIRIVSRDQQHLVTLLQYYNDNYLKDSQDCKIQFVKSLLDHTNVLIYDSKCWSLLMDILNTTNLSIEKSDASDYDDDEQTCVKAIIVHEVINNKDVPEIISKKINFDSFKEYHKKMNSQERKLLFDYLYNRLLKKIEQQNLFSHVVFEENVKLIKSMLRLLKDWQKNIYDYPYVLNKIKELIKAKQDNSLNANLSWIYDINKSWRKYMFEESIILCASERVCVNALKHDPSLLNRNEKVVSAMRCNDTVSLRQLLSKIKVYWPESFGSQWSQAYHERLSQPLGHKALMRGLSILLPQRELLYIINAYKPDNSKINWEENDVTLISLRKHIAKNIHFARPQPTPDDILQYAKGDYLQFALPSLNAILYNLCPVRCHELIPRLLDSPVSLQKHGIRLAFAKMQSEDLQRIFGDYWKTIKNLSIRAVIFKLTYELLCKEKNPVKANNIWNLLKVFIDALTFEEDKTIYQRLTQVQKVPLNVRPFFVMKSYSFLKSLLPKSDLDRKKYEQALDSMIYVMDELIDSMEPEFLNNIFQEYYAAVYTEDKTDKFVHRDLMRLMASYVTYTGNAEIQAQRYNLILLPLLRNTVSVWSEKDNKDIVKTNFRNLLKLLRNKLKFVTIQNKIIPVTMFADIQKELENSLSQKSYLMLREWKLTSAFAKVLNDKKGKVERSNYNKDNDYWNAVCMKTAPQFGEICLEYLKEDIKSFFPCIDEYFSKALRNVLADLIGPDVVIEVLKHFLVEDLTQSYLVTIRTLPHHCRLDKEKGTILSELHKIILSHPSLEVKMHFYHKNDHYKRIA